MKNLNKMAQFIQSQILVGSHTSEQSDLIRRELGVWAEDATLEQIQQLLETAVNGGFRKELDVLMHHSHQYLGYLQEKYGWNDGMFEGDIKALLAELDNKGFDITQSTKRGKTWVEHLSPMGTFSICHRCEDELKYIGLELTCATLVFF